MSNSSNKEIKLVDRGQITLPANFRKKYSLKTGQRFSITDLGEGYALFSPKISEVDKIAEAIEEEFKKKKISLGDLLDQAQKIREKK